MQDNELEYFMNEFYRLHEQIGELESRLYTVEQDNKFLLSQNEWLREILSEQIANLNSINDTLMNHCNSFHSMLILGGKKKDEDNIP